MFLGRGKGLNVKYDMFKLHLSSPLIQMEAQSSSTLLLSRKRRRDGSNGEAEEGERLGKIPRCTVVSLCALRVTEHHVYPAVSGHNAVRYTLLQKSPKQ